MFGAAGRKDCRGVLTFFAPDPVMDLSDAAWNLQGYRRGGLGGSLERLARMAQGFGGFLIAWVPPRIRVSGVAGWG